MQLRINVLPTILILNQVPPNTTPKSLNYTYMFEPIYMLVLRGRIFVGNPEV
jgi:hypothetical protein